MAALPALKRSATSGARMAVLDRPITRVYANRPMWQTPERKHWLNEMANQNSYLTHAVGIVGCMVAAQFIVVNFGGSGYGAPQPPKPLLRRAAPIFLRLGAAIDRRFGGAGAACRRAGPGCAWRGVWHVFRGRGPLPGARTRPLAKAGGKSVHHSVATSSR